MILIWPHAMRIVFCLKNGHLIANGPPAEVLTPELLATVYGIRADIYRDEGGLHILQRGWLDRGCRQTYV